MRVFSFLVLCCLFISPPAYARAPSYKKILKKYTRHNEVYQREDIYASISWHVTWQADEFLQAKVAKIAKIYRHDENEKESQRRSEQGKFGDFESFFVSFYSYDFKNADLSRSTENWQLTLSVDGEEFSPVRIEKVGTLSPLKQVLFPYSNLWARHYFVYFPKVASYGKKIELRVDGPYGHSALTW